MVPFAQILNASTGALLLHFLVTAFIVLATSRVLDAGSVRSCLLEEKETCTGPSDCLAVWGRSRSQENMLLQQAWRVAPRGPHDPASHDSPSHAHGNEGSEVVHDEDSGFARQHSKHVMSVATEREFVHDFASHMVSNATRIGQSLAAVLRNSGFKARTATWAASVIIIIPTLVVTLAVCSLCVLAGERSAREVTSSISSRSVTCAPSRMPLRCSPEPAAAVLHKGSALHSPSPGLRSPQPPAAHPSACLAGTFEAHTEDTDTESETYTPMNLAEKSVVASKQQDAEVNGAVKGTPRCLNLKLLVPAQQEFVFAIRDEMTHHMQQTSFDVMDLRGNRLCEVFLREKSETDCGIWVYFTNHEPLACIRTAMLHRGRAAGKATFDSGKAGLTIHRPNGELFCHIVREDSSSSIKASRFLVKGDPDGKLLATFEGDFANKCVNGRGPTGNLVCATKRCTVGLQSAPLTSYYEVRVAAHADAGLMLCALLAIFKADASHMAACH